MITDKQRTFLQELISQAMKKPGYDDIYVYLAYRFGMMLDFDNLEKLSKSEATQMISELKNAFMPFKVLFRNADFLRAFGFAEYMPKIREALAPLREATLRPIQDFVDAIDGVLGKPDVQLIDAPHMRGAPDAPQELLDALTGAEYNEYNNARFGDLLVARMGVDSYEIIPLSNHRVTVQKGKLGYSRDIGFIEWKLAYNEIVK